MQEGTEYPRDHEREIRLKDEARVRIRPIRPDDEPGLVALYSRLSPGTAYQRFFWVLRRLPNEWAHHFANVDYRRRLALVAESSAEGTPKLVGVARYEPTDEQDTAEVALVVQDGWQDRGLGTILLNDLLRAAEARGIRQFRAYVLSDNDRMLHMLARLTDIRERRIEAGVTDLLFTRRGTAASNARE